MNNNAWFILPIWVKYAGEENPEYVIQRFNDELIEKMDGIAQKLVKETGGILDIEWTVNRKIDLERD